MAIKTIGLHELEQGSDTRFGSLSLPNKMMLWMFYRKLLVSWEILYEEEKMMKL